MPYTGAQFSEFQKNLLKLTVQKAFNNDSTQ